MIYMGGNPYSSAFYPQLLAAFARTTPDIGAHPPHLGVWLYPPQWYGPLWGLGHLNVYAFLLVWRLISLALVIGGIIRLCRAVPGAGRGPGMMLFWAIFSYGTAVNLEDGQSSVLLLAGLCGLSAGVIGGQPKSVFWGLLLMLFKPQLGLPLTVAALLTRRTRAAAGVAMLASAVLALPQFLAFGLRTSLHQLVANNAMHDALRGNSFDYLINFQNPLHRLLGVSVTNVFGISLYFALAALCAVLWLKSGDVATRARGCVLLIVGALFLLPMHDYDIIVLTAALPLCPLLGRPARWAVFVAYGLSLSLDLLIRLHIPGVAWYPGLCQETLAMASAVAFFGVVGELVLVRLGKGGRKHAHPLAAPLARPLQA